MSHNDYCMIHKAVSIVARKVFEGAFFLIDSIITHLELFDWPRIRLRVLVHS